MPKSLDARVDQAIEEGKFDFFDAVQLVLFKPLCSIGIDGEKFIMRLTYSPLENAERTFYWVLDCLLDDEGRPTTLSGERVLNEALEAGLKRRSNGRI